MKTLITFSLLLLASFSKAQTVTKAHLNDKVILVGHVDALSGKIKDGLFKAHLAQSNNQIALVASKDFTSTYYVITYSDKYIVKTGKFSKNSEGEFDLIDLGSIPGGYSITFSSTPLIAHF